MKIAVPCMDTQIAQHFGHCENFRVFATENRAITAETSIANPGHKPGFLPNYLGDMGVEVIIAGGLGGGAADLLKERGIEIVTGASGDAREAVVAYLKGELKSTGTLCHEHEHEHEHGEGCGSSKKDAH